MNYQHLVQDSLSDNKEIIERIKKELLEAQREILVAMAWFTDDDLFKILLNKADQGLEISIIIAEHADNEKLDFDLLNTKPNGEVIKIKNVGYGMMHQKFCIIDKEVVINGSYNWSKNAKNNHENVIVTNFSKTVEEFLNTFHDMKDRAIQVLSGVPINQIQVNNNYVQSQRDTKPMEKLSFQEQSLIEFKQVLDNIIATEVGSLDKGLISQSAYNRAKENNGDHQVLPQAMDSLYSNFINEIEVVAEKKTRLKNRIDEQLKLSVGNIEIKTENEINTKKENYQLEDKNLKENILNTEKEMEKAQSTIESNLKTQVPFFQAQIEKIRQKINEQRIEFVKPPID
ncbi:phospholipase D-like domain-containing protein, partial [Sphingobacterium sp. SGL-16]|uniref:phospholipase D-like domain-containing protein n=1 Tax=Sphingobacterium sp. SGL-16 TaxID=2710883 RepID=UPI0013ED594E